MKDIGVRLLLLGACALVACEEKGPRDATAVPRLQAGAGGNAEAIAQLADQQCVGRAADLNDFEYALGISGWNFKRTQKSDPDKELSLDAWKSDAARIIRGEVVTDHVFHCQLAIVSDFSPSDDEMQKILASRYGEPDANGNRWEFDGPNGSRYKLDISSGAEAAYGTHIFVEELR